MTDELTRAAADASEALGMSVEVVRVGVYRVPRIEICGPIDGPENGLPVEIANYHDDHAALAYLNGLETGSRIMRERYATLVNLDPATKLAPLTRNERFTLADALLEKRRIENGK